MLPQLLDDAGNCIINRFDQGQALAKNVIQLRRGVGILHLGNTQIVRVVLVNPWQVRAVKGEVQEKRLVMILLDERRAGPALMEDPGRVRCNNGNTPT
jgi:hypothetical protein